MDKPNNFRKKIYIHIQNQNPTVFLSNYDDDHNDDFKKTIGFTLMIKSTALHVHHVF